MSEEETVKIELHTIATYDGKEYELEELMNNMFKINAELHSIIKEVREYITSYESIETIQQCEHSENNKGLDRDTMIEMTNRYLKVHDKTLEILDKER